VTRTVIWALTLKTLSMSSSRAIEQLSSVKLWAQSIATLLLQRLRASLGNKLLNAEQTAATRKVGYVAPPFTQGVFKLSSAYSSKRRLVWGLFRNLLNEGRSQGSSVGIGTSVIAEQPKILRFDVREVRDFCLLNNSPMNSGVFLDITPRDYCKNRRFGGT
jgi:hypothetical protein